MLDFPIKVNNIIFMSSEIIPYIRKCKSNEAIEYIIKKTSCTVNEAEEVVTDIKNMIHNKGYSMHTDNKTNTFNTCPNCGKKYPFLKIKCDECGYSLNKNTDKKESLNQYAEDIKNIPRCPICQSTDLSKISATKKATKVGLFGIFGAGDIGKTWKCNNCGSKF